MRHVLLAALLVFPCFVLEAQTVDGVAVETEHLMLVWTERYDEETVASVKRRAEALYAGTEFFVSDEASAKPVVVFRGAARTGRGPGRDFPHVDGQGVVHLFRFSDDIDNYFHAFVHELVHALRIHRKDEADWFFEEGFAEYVRLRVYDSMDGFPWFGFPVSVVAAGHVKQGSAIPLEVLRSRHDQLNDRCRAQAYALRAAFFDWLGSEFGDERLLAMSQEASAGQLEHYRKHFGRSFDELASQWVAKAKEDYDAQAFGEYMANTPIRHVPICDAGNDF